MKPAKPIHHRRIRTHVSCDYVIERGLSNIALLGECCALHSRSPLGPWPVYVKSGTIFIDGA